MGARNVLITRETGAFALVREAVGRAASVSTSSQLESVSPVGSGDALLAGFLAARSAGARSRSACARPSAAAPRTRARAARAGSIRAT